MSHHNWSLTVYHPHQSTSPNQPQTRLKDKLVFKRLIKKIPIDANISWVQKFLLYFRKIFLYCWHWEGVWWSSGEAISCEGRYPPSEHSIPTTSVSRSSSQPPSRQWLPDWRWGRETMQRSPASPVVILPPWSPGPPQGGAGTRRWPTRLWSMSRVSPGRMQVRREQSGDNLVNTWHYRKLYLLCREWCWISSSWHVYPGCSM